MKQRLLSGIAAGFIRAVGASLRMTVEDRAGVLNRTERPPVIFAFWHNRIMSMIYLRHRYCPGRSCVALISRSRDGEFISRVTTRFGTEAARGSSSRHGARAALEAVHAARDPRTDLAVTPDGPRGPRCRVRPGVLRLAQATGRPIVPVTCELGAKQVLRSWDRFQVPWPFSTCHLITHPAIPVPEHAEAEELENLRLLLEKTLGDN